MENNENLPKKPSRWTMFWNPEAMQQYYDKLEKNLKQREDGLTQRENDIQQREKGDAGSRSREKQRVCSEQNRPRNRRQIDGGR